MQLFHLHSCFTISSFSFPTPLTTSSSFTMMISNRLEWKFCCAIFHDFLLLCGMLMMISQSWMLEAFQSYQRLIFHSRTATKNFQFFTIITQAHYRALLIFFIFTFLFFPVREAHNMNVAELKIFGITFFEIKYTKSTIVTLSKGLFLGL